MISDTIGERAARDAAQVAWQRRAAAALDKILERAAAEGLPPIAWTVATAGIEVRGECLAHPADARRDDFIAWRTAVGVWPIASPTVRARAQQTTARPGSWISGTGSSCRASRARA